MSYGSKSRPPPPNWSSISCRLYNCPSNATKEKSSVSVRLKNATSPFFAASTKLVSAAISVCSSGLSVLAGAFACPTPPTARAQPIRITKTTNPYFIPVSLPRVSKTHFSFRGSLLPQAIRHSVDRCSPKQFVVPRINARPSNSVVPWINALPRTLSFRRSEVLPRQFVIPRSEVLPKQFVIPRSEATRNLLFSRHTRTSLAATPAFGGRSASSAAITTPLDDGLEPLRYLNADSSLSLNPPRQLPARHRNLLPRRQILHRKRIRLHFILTHNKNVLRPRLRRRFKRFFQPEALVSQLDHQIMLPQLARQPRRLPIHPRHRSHIHIRLPQHALGRLLQRHHQPVFPNRKPNPRSRRSAQRLRKPVIPSPAQDRVLRPQRPMRELERRPRVVVEPAH